MAPCLHFCLHKAFFVLPIMSAVVQDKGSAEAFDLEKTDVVAAEHDVPEFDDPNLYPDGATAGLAEDDSPYPEVRSAVANTDDPTIPVSTLRAWTLGMIWAIIIPGLNQFFFFRYPSVTVTGIIAQLVSFPLGRLWARLVPNVKILGVDLNPGPFTIKEHVLITIMASVGAGSAYATDIVAVQRVYYNQIYNFSFQWLVVMSTQLIGFSIGGIARRFLVQPPSMIWPANLVTCALFNTLHSTEYAGVGSRGGYSRERFFYIALACGATWYILPGWLFTALSYFSWGTLLDRSQQHRRKPTVRCQLWSRHGGEIFLRSCLQSYKLTFQNSSSPLIGLRLPTSAPPLATPWWAEANIAVGFVFFFWILTPILYFTNTWYSKYMPISSSGSFDNTGASYNVTRILNADTTFDLESYEAYSPLFLSTTFAISYGLSFASITATITHAFLFFRKQIWTQSRRAMHEQPDIHARLMAVYPQVPEWWYLIIFISMFVCGVVSIQVWETHFPVQYFILALVIAFVYIIPIGMIQAITNQQVGLNVITELIIGYALPGHPIAMMMFKTWGYITMAQALTFSSDFKLVIATIVAGTVQLGVQAWMFTNIEGMCDRDQKDGFWCPSTVVFGTASIIWGVIGPARQFSSGQIYYALTFFFLVGFICPVIAWLISLKWPNSIIRYVKYVCSSLSFSPEPVPFRQPARLITSLGRSLGSSSNTLSAAATSPGGRNTTTSSPPPWTGGVAISAVLIFFILEYPRGGTIGANNIAKWWGNNVYINTADGQKTPMIALAPGATFGPQHW
ncbi:OPT oligopeptide transporter [Mycena sanguinolenta]|uniref:OPT oligopeptide transporter n=1 Tax=Mycena sanguinolenta TaxID=230812 RepID=A0A8H6YBL7_9AGAR|nr:OPT oligopeptide transporter [Mycena sanguinolenta]